MKISFAALEVPQTGVVAVGVLEDRVLTPSAQQLDDRLKGALRRAIEASRFHGKPEQTLSVLAPGGGELDRVLLVGLGKAEDLDVRRFQAVGGRIYAGLAGNGHVSAVVCVDAIDGAPVPPALAAAEMALGARLRGYRFAKYLTKENEDERPALSELTFVCPDVAAVAPLNQPRSAVADGVLFTRDLVSEPSNVIYPETFATAARALSELGVEVDVLGEAQMQALGMGALLGVGQGSQRESQLLVLQWWGAGKPDPRPVSNGSEDLPEVDDHGPVAIIGKGVTFDSGGISIKPAAGMEDMKWDMAGAGAVVGLFKALAGRKAKANVVGLCGLVENMPSGTAQRPGDVVKSLSGQTIEVINTDAEGRLVLSDVLWYCKQRFRPRLMIDLATLTGAIIIALGHERAGLFSNNDELAGRIAAAADAVGEDVWRMPLGDAYDKLIKSDVADMKNVGDRSAGSISAAQFLQRFVGKTPWAHLDIAGVAWGKKDKDLTPKGASGFGVRLLDRLIADHYEQR